MTALPTKLIFFTAFVAVLLWPPSLPPDIEATMFIKGVVMPLSRILDESYGILQLLKVKNPFMVSRFVINGFTTIESKLKPTNTSIINIHEKYFDGVRVLVFQPEQVDNNASVLYFHGGGYVLGSPETHSKLTKELALRLKSVVVSVDYRLGPEHVHPALFDDVIKATKYFFQQGYKDYQLDPKRIILMGDSAGGHISAALASHFSKSPEVQIKATVLIYPVTQSLSHNTPSCIENDQDVMLPRWKMHVFRLLYYQGNSHENYSNYQANNFATLAIRKSYADKYDLPELLNRGESKDDGEGDPQMIAKFKHLYEDPLNSPLFGDVSNYPPTYIVSCKYDVLRDDSFMLERRLKKANRNVKHVNVNSFHGFINFFDNYPTAGRVLDDIVTFILAQR